MMIIVGSLSLLICHVSFLVYREVEKGDFDRAAIFGGFPAIVFGLLGSIGFVLFEADRLEAAKDGNKAEKSD